MIAPEEDPTCDTVSASPLLSHASYFSYVLFRVDNIF